MCRPQDSSKWINEAKQLSNDLKTDAKWDWKHKSEIDLNKFEWYKRQEFLEDFYESCGNIGSATVYCLENLKNRDVPR
jgi:hypothetical protein